jgi:hypothetical protein
MLHCKVRQVWKHTKETFSLNHGYQLLQETFIYGRDRQRWGIVFHADIILQYSVALPPISPALQHLAPAPAPAAGPGPTPHIFQLRWNKEAEEREKEEFSVLCLAYVCLDMNTLRTVSDASKSILLGETQSFGGIFCSHLQCRSLSKSRKLNRTDGVENMAVMSRVGYSSALKTEATFSSETSGDCNHVQW